MTKLYSFLLVAALVAAGCGDDGTASDSGTDSGVADSGAADSGTTDSSTADSSTPPDGATDSSTPPDGATDSGTPSDGGDAGRNTMCDDGDPVLCEIVPPVCDADSILAGQDGCWVCVNPATCRPWGEAGCESDMGCSANSYCDGCATSSCPVCDDCVAGCVMHSCPTETMLTCRCARPDCGAGNTSVIVDGCWECVNIATCEPARGGCE